MTTGTHPHLEFGVVSDFVGFEAVLAVHGEVDICSAADLAGHLDEAIERGHRFVVVDLAELDFIDGSGLGVIGTYAERLSLAGGALTIRSPSAMVQRLLGIVGLGDVVRLEHPVRDQAEPEDLARVTAIPLRSDTTGLSHYLRTVTAVPADDDVVNGALRLVVALARETVGGADGVSVSLRRQGHLKTVAASDQTILDMDAQQYDTGEGPCVDASVEGRRFHAGTLSTELRWPAFTPKAQALGINAIMSSPLLARSSPVGALNIYSRTAAAFAPKDQELASVFAHEASVILSDAGADVTDIQLDRRLGEALRAREVISLAQGIIMERDGSGEEGAYTTLRRSSIGSGRPLREHAERILSSTRLLLDNDAAPPAEDHHG